ncbi:PaaI family thioesterase [Thermodesulfobacteriota bacterium]
MMDPKLKAAIQRMVQQEPFARTLNLELIFLEEGHSIIEMDYEPGVMANIYGRTHGGAIYALIDEAFETAGQTNGTIAVALNVSVTYIASPQDRERLRAEAKEICQTKKTATYEIKVTQSDGRLIATCQALAYRTDKPIPL